MAGTLAAPADAAVRSQPRIHSLDGLRGVGALVVVIHHALLVVPALSVMYLAPDGGQLGTPAPWSVEWWLYSTPLRLIWGGHEAVLVFFVLSGIVLAAPLMTRPRHGVAWLGYYLRRLCRLYVPVWASLVLAVGCAAIVPRGGSAGGTWLTSHPDPSIAVVVRDAFLLTGTSKLNSPLWSLQWEILFSLLLPVMFLVLRAVRVTRWPVVAVVLLAVVSAAAQVPALRHVLPRSYLTGGALQYLPIFAIGMIIAMCPDQVSRLRQALTDAPRAVRAGWIVVALVLTVSPTYMGAARRPDQLIADPVGFGYQLTTVAGVTMIVLAALTMPSLIGLLQSRLLQYAGSRSFSIYLVHEPILVSVAIATQAAGYFPWLLVAPAAIILALLVAEGFYRLVERPAIRLSRKLDIRAA